ncbi:MAG: methionyl-tRNA formyltransferase [Kiritimatiellaeota bacterium]|nr:methionyl-tRNA formyltransferase [Kiritimatiellota bacterium]
MRIIFMGSGDVGCPVVARLLASTQDELIAVVTQPDRPQGRKLQLAVPVLTPAKCGAPDFIAQLAALKPDLIVVAAYGQFLTRALLDLPPHGVINVHPSLLPKYRGAAPIQWAVARGEKETGVSIIYLIEKMDAGDILQQARVPIAPDSTAAELTPQLSALGADLLMRAVENIRTGTVRRIRQDDALATRAPLLKKTDGRLDWSRPAAELHDRIRGLFPWPGCSFEWPRGSEKRVKVLKAVPTSGSGEVGTMISNDPRQLIVACGSGALQLLEVQPEGKKPMPAAAFLNGAHLSPGDRLG